MLFFLESLITLWFIQRMWPRTSACYSLVGPLKTFNAQQEQMGGLHCLLYCGFRSCVDLTRCLLAFGRTLFFHYSLYFRIHRVKRAQNFLWMSLSSFKVSALSLFITEWGGRFRPIKETVVIGLFYNRIFELSPTGHLLDVCEWMSAKGGRLSIKRKGNPKRSIKTVPWLFQARLERKH